MHAPLVKYPFDDCSNLLGCCKGWSRGGLVCSLVQLYASRVVGLTMQENFRCSNDSVVLATIRRSCNKSRNKSSNVEHGAVNERTGTRCGFTFRARAFRAFLVLFYLLVICACPRWLLAVGRTWRLQQFSTWARLKSDFEATKQNHSEVAANTLRQRTSAVRAGPNSMPVRPAPFLSRQRVLCRAPSRLGSVPIRVQVLVRYRLVDLSGPPSVG